MDQVIEGLVTIIRGLDNKKRRELFKNLASNGILTEDEQDIITIESRRGGAATPLEQAVRKIKNKKL